MAKGANGGPIFIIVIVVLGILVFTMGSSSDKQTGQSEKAPISFSGRSEPATISKPAVVSGTAIVGSDNELGPDTIINEAKAEREEIREVIPHTQPVPQPVGETLEVVEDDGYTSVYAGLIELLHTKSGPASSDVNKEYIQIKSTSKNQANVNITNWSIRSSVTGRNVTIGKYEKLFYSGRAGSKEIVILAPKEKIYVLTSRSPIGSSFVVNKCIGYLTQFQDFYPTIFTNCPAPEDEILYYSKDPGIFLDNVCMDFVDKIPMCRIQTEPFPASISPSCQEAILQEINYNSCVDKHRNDEDFYSTERRIYLKYGSEIWREKREIIELIDEYGRVVDFFDY